VAAAIRRRGARLAFERLREHNDAVRIGRAGLRRIVSATFTLMSAAAVLPVACSGFPFPPGYVAGPVTGVPSTCEGDAYLAVPAQDCPASQCFAPVAFAVCDGTSFSGCTCTQPPGVLIPGLDAREGSEGGFVSEAGFGSDNGIGSDGSSCGVFDGGEAQCAAGDGPFFDVGDRGDCSGQVAERVLASECDSCPKPYAYFLCDGLFFSTCSCELPPGYDLIDGGRLDAGTKDATKETDAPKDVAKDVTHDAAKDVTRDAPKDGAQDAVKEGAQDVAPDSLKDTGATAQ
jgi:hypothetical protein